MQYRGNNHNVSLAIIVFNIAQHQCRTSPTCNQSYNYEFTPSLKERSKQQPAIQLAIMYCKQNSQLHTFCSKIYIMINNCVQTKQFALHVYLWLGLQVNECYIRVYNFITVTNVVIISYYYNTCNYVYDYTHTDYHWPFNAKVFKVAIAS